MLKFCINCDKEVEMEVDDDDVEFCPNCRNTNKELVRNNVVQQWTQLKTRL